MASFWSRLGAALIDGLILGAPGYILWIVLASSTVNSSRFEVCETELGEPEFCDPVTWSDFRSIAVAFLVYGLVSFAATLLYYGIMDGRRGQTVGRRVVGIRLVDADSWQPIGAGRAIGRQFGKAISSFACYLGFLWMTWDDRGQTWHDKMVRSIVVDASPRPSPGMGYPAPPSWTQPPPHPTLPPPPPAPSEIRQDFTHRG